MQGTSMTHNLFRALAALALAGLAWSGPALAVDDDDDTIRWTNGLSTGDVRFNALSANHEANPRMVQVSLSTASYDPIFGEPALRDKLRDPSARKFLEYVVSCALGPSGLVEWHGGGNTYQWRGSIGLCPAWGTGPASLQCQRWVSACVLARNNALERRVLLSARGYMPAQPSLFLPMPAVRTDPFEHYTDTPVPSTEACSSPTSGTRNCGWQLDRVGRCRAGDSVRLGGGGIPPGDSCDTGSPLGTTLDGSNMLRVCDGLGACDSSTALAESDGTCTLLPPAVSFTCPASETFSVLVGPVDSAETGKMELAAQSAAFPAPEGIIFPIREGAFYGNLFGEGALNPDVNVYFDDNGVIQGKSPIGIRVVYPQMFSCADPGWSTADAYATSRLCTGRDANCVAKPLGRCNDIVSGAPRCRRDNVMGIDEYGDCLDSTGNSYPQVVTPHLNEPCALVNNTAACERLHPGS